MLSFNVRDSLGRIAFALSFLVKREGRGNRKMQEKIK